MAAGAPRFSLLDFFYRMTNFLDFTEISPSIHPSSDTEAFEKFGKQFFEEVFDGVIEKTAGRGADGRVDLIVRVGEERWLISCKHNLKSSVTAVQETDPRGRLDAYGCTKFVGFYSGSPCNSLNSFLYGIQANNPSFDFEIMNGRDIEARLFSFSNVRGWLLSARWFPRSYSRLFSQLVYPICQYDITDIVVHEESGIAHAPYSGMTIHFSPGSKLGSDGASKLALSIANENATSNVFSGIFFQRVCEFAAAFPGSFAKTKFLPDSDLTHRSVYPSWDFQVLKEWAINRGNLRAAWTVCRVWSLWDSGYAGQFLRAIRVLYSIPRDKIPETVSTYQDAYALYERHMGPSEEVWLGLESRLSLSDIAAEYSTSARGYFASLLSFMPSGLCQKPPQMEMIVWLAKHFNENTELEKRLRTISSLLTVSDQQYVAKNSGTLVELLRSVWNVDIVDKKFVHLLETGLSCFSDDGLELWAPNSSISPELLSSLQGT